VLEVTKLRSAEMKATDVLEGQRRFAIFVRLKEDYAIKWKSSPTSWLLRQLVDAYRWANWRHFKLSSGDSVIDRESRCVESWSCATSKAATSASFGARCAAGCRIAGDDATRHFITWGGQFENAQQARAPVADCYTDSRFC